MRKGLLILLTVLSIVVIGVSCISCGSDDKEIKNVDGVSVVNGKKLVELNIAIDEYNYKFKVDYDKSGRMTRITIDNIEIAKIDYDLRDVTIIKNSYSSKYLSYGFILNNDGFISQIETCSLTYDSNGYLTDVEEANKYSILSYNSNDLIKASVSGLTAGNLSLYYVTYGDSDSSGDLYVKVNRNDGNSKGSFDYFNTDNVVCLIAYQAGLFGKVSKSVMNFRNKKDANAFFEYINNSKSSTGKITFVCQ